jgi:site-specific recombinase XerD
LCKDRPQDAPIFTRADGLQWNKDAWKDPIKEAVRAAGLPASATAYTLRHSVITDLVLSGVELLTIANLAGTSAKMIEKHYWHLRQKAATEALATLDLDADAPPLPPPPPAVDYGDADQI